MNKAYVFRLYPNKEQRTLLTKTFGCTRFIWNMILSDKKDYYERTGKTLKTTPAKYKKEFPWLKEVDSLALANEQLSLEKSYKNFWNGKGKVGFPKFKSKHKDKNSYTTNYVNGNIRIDQGKIKLPKLGTVSIKQHREIPKSYQLKSCTITQDPDGKYYISILFAYEEKLEQQKVKDIVGLDFSMKELYVDSNGGIPEYPRYYRKAQEKLAREQRKLSKCEKCSNNRNKQRKIVAKLHKKVSNQRKDFLHKQSRQITNAYDAVVVENLNMKDMSRALKIGKSVHDNGWGMFVQFMQYKLYEAGKQLIKVDKWFPSSKTCSVCGKKKNELALSERVYICECGNIMDRDKNAAINIRQEGLRVLGIA
ncbi:RNA-guided endonuclease InsQ/TnpB family protein [Lacrimispora brassicae]